MADNLNYVEFGDFRPGIYQVPGVSHPTGAATDENTYRCMSVESGALVGAPRRTTIVQRRPNTLAAEDPTRTYSRVFINGIQLNGPVFAGAGENVSRGVDLSRSEIWVGFEWQVEQDPPTSEGVQHREVCRYLRNDTSPVWEDIYTLPTYNTQGRRYPSRWTGVRTTANQTTPTDLGNPVMAWLFERTNDAGMAYFPDDTAPSGTGVVQIDSSSNGPSSGTSSNEPPQEMVGHQNRLIIFPLNVYNNGPSQVYGNTQGFYYTKVNDPTERETGIGFFDNVTGVENPSGYADFASLTADELLLIKRQGGALIMRGPVTDAQVVTLPNFKSPGFAQCRGTTSPVGFMYPVENGGVWAWQGGDLCEHISKQMDPDFWRPLSDDGYEVAPSSSAQMGQFVFMPNNWFYDTDHGGWWKVWPNRQDEERLVTDAEQMWHWSTDHNDRWVYGTPRHMSWYDEDGNDISNDLQDVCWEFDQRHGATDYSWQSHPLTASMDRQVTAREVMLVASGYGSVTVTVSSLQSGQNESRTVYVNSDWPVKQALKFSVQGTHIQVRFQAEGLEDDSLSQDVPGTGVRQHDAPTIYPTTAVGLQESKGVATAIAE